MGKMSGGRMVIILGDDGENINNILDKINPLSIENKIINESIIRNSIIIDKDFNNTSKGPLITEQRKLNNLLKILLNSEEQIVTVCIDDILYYHITILYEVMRTDYSISIIDIDPSWDLTDSMKNNICDMYTKINSKGE